MTTTRIRIREDFPTAPICPHCGKEIQEIAARRVESTLGVRFLYGLPALARRQPIPVRRFGNHGA